MAMDKVDKVDSKCDMCDMAMDEADSCPMLMASILKQVTKVKQMYGFVL